MSEPLMRRWEVMEKFLKNTNPLLGAEVGVKEGKFISHLLAKFPRLDMFAIDPWEVQEGEKEDYKDWDFISIYDEYRDRTKDVYDRVREMRMYSEDAAKIIEDGSLDFVFIDAQHDYESVKKDIALWLPKVRPGGIISGHDYSYDPTYKHYEITKAVDEMIPERWVTHDLVWMARA